jgi:hypothetical protein
MKIAATLAGAATLLAGAGGAGAASVAPAEGPWTGETTAGLRVSFEVKEGKITDPLFFFRWGYCGVFESQAPPSTSSAVDESGGWRYLEPSGPWIEGDVVASDRIEGKVVAPERELPSCPRSEVDFVAVPGESAPTMPPRVAVVGEPESGRLVSRPARLQLEEPDEFYFYGIRWRRFGGATALGKGTAFIRGCAEKRCDREARYRSPATLTLSRLTRRGDYKVYTRLHFTIHGPTPYGYRPSESIEVG